MGPLIYSYLHSTRMGLYPILIYDEIFPSPHNKATLLRCRQVPYCIIPLYLFSPWSWVYHASVIWSLFLKFFVGWFSLSLCLRKKEKGLFLTNFTFLDRSNFLGTKFTVYDAQPPHAGATVARSRSTRLVGLKQVSPRVPAGNYPVIQIAYELNVLGSRWEKVSVTSQFTIAYELKV